MGSWPILVMLEETWAMPSMYPEETRTVIHERLPRVHASPTSADHWCGAHFPLPPCRPQSRTREDTPPASVGTRWLRGRGVCTGRCGLMLAWSPWLVFMWGPHKAAAEEIEVRPAKHVALQHL